ncbi:hypothetical protein CVT24_010045 [Panaeolus cyanescens]|uniref:Uncharacterized protein n=1 Tax=Panaeolus cyanescens TaxID=181874 RepID=A0A409WM45_9AGAR|nr:hypothetical protein CVT24_010045 [Panaeolus cyanescens]
MENNPLHLPASLLDRLDVRERSLQSRISNPGEIPLLDRLGVQPRKRRRSRSMSPLPNDRLESTPQLGSSSKRLKHCSNSSGMGRSLEMRLSDSLDSAWEPTHQAMSPNPDDEPMISLLGNSSKNQLGSNKPELQVNDSHRDSTPTHLDDPMIDGNMSHDEDEGEGFAESSTRPSDRELRGIISRLVGASIGGQPETISPSISGDSSVSGGVDQGGGAPNRVHEPSSKPKRCKIKRSQLPWTEREARASGHWSAPILRQNTTIAPHL